MNVWEFKSEGRDFQGSNVVSAAPYPCLQCVHEDRVFLSSSHQV